MVGPNQFSGSWKLQLSSRSHSLTPQTPLLFLTKRNPCNTALNGYLGPLLFPFLTHPRTTLNHFPFLVNFFPGKFHSPFSHSHHSNIPYLIYNVVYPLKEVEKKDPFLNLGVSLFFFFQFFSQIPCEKENPFQCKSGIVVFVVILVIMVKKLCCFEWIILSTLLLAAVVYSEHHGNVTMPLFFFLWLLKLVWSMFCVCCSCNWMFCVNGFGYLCVCITTLEFIEWFLEK